MITELTSDYIFKLGIDAAGKVTLDFASENIYAVTGRRSEEIRELDTWTSIFSPDDLSRVMQLLHSMSKTPQTGELECHTYINHGQSRWVHVTAKSQWSEAEQRVVSIIGSVKDITERKQTEKALRVSEERYRTLSEAAYDMIYIVNRNDIVEYVNTSAAELFNRRPEEIVGKIRTSLFLPNVSIGQQRSLQSVFETGVPKHVESKAAYNEQVIWLSTWLVPMRDDAGQITAVMGVSRDITNRKWLEEDKQKLLHKLQEALSQVKTLSGLLPICSVCKKIRDDNGYWQQVENYIQRHTDATFTHGVCPDCFPKLYPDFDSDNLDKTKG